MPTTAERLRELIAADKIGPAAKWPERRLVPNMLANCAETIAAVITAKDSPDLWTARHALDRAIAKELDK